MTEKTVMERAAAQETVRNVVADFRTTFSSPRAVGVLAELKRFCHADETCFHADQRIHAFRDGQRSVWLLIQKYRERPLEELMAIDIAEIEENNNG